MKKKRWKVLILLILCCILPVTVNAGGGDDDKTSEVPASYNVKCEYKLKDASTQDHDDLTTLYVYVDEKNSKYKLTYLDKSSKEKDGKPNYNISDYQNYDKIKHMIKYSDNSGSGGFQYFDYNYKNASNSCPALYVHFMGGSISDIYIHKNYNGSIANVKIDVSKKYTSTDGGKTWSAGGGNTASDKLTEIRSCNYNFLTDIGRLADWPLIVSIKFQKQKNETKNKDVYNIYFETESNGQKYKYENLNVLGQSPATTVSYAGKQLGDTFVIFHSEATVKAILDGSSCLDASKVYFYDYGDWSGYRRFDVTTDYKEAESYSLYEIYDGNSGTELLNAKAEYDKALQALKDAMKKFDDNNWATESNEECTTLFGGIDDGSNQLVNNYNKAKERLKKAWSKFDFSKGDETLGKFKSYECNSGELVPGTPVYGCEVIPEEIRLWIKDALNLVKYIALAIVIVLGILDFLKAAGSGEAETMKKSGTDFLKRIIAVIILFLVPLIVDLILNLIEIFGADGTCI